MNASKSQRQETILTEDGELKQAVDSLATQTEALFCTNCGTANKSSSRFCRKCGQSLDDQEIEVDSAYRNIAAEYKGKRSPQRLAHPQAAGAPMNLWMLIFQLALLTVIGALVYFTARDGLWGLSLAVLMAWFIVEGMIYGTIK